MWLLCGAASVLFCAAGWLMAWKDSGKALWASVCSLTFVSLTLLMGYRQVVVWVNKGDWSALLDVVPSMFSILAGYLIIMFAANLFLVFFAGRKR